MSIRLYDSAWVQVEGIEQPQQARKNRQNPASFFVGDHQYDIDAMPYSADRDAPRILSIFSLQAAKEAGLRNEYRPGAGNA